MKNECEEYELVYSSETDYYKEKERCSASKYNRKCINGQVVGCTKCVGFCNYFGHEGFLTEKLRSKHNCIEKHCWYYIGRKNQF